MTLAGDSTRLFDLSVRTSFPLPRWLESTPAGADGPDVEVVAIETDEQLLDQQAVVTADRTVITFAGWARLTAAGGRDITVEHPPGVDVRALHLILIGPAMAYVLQQRGALVLHGSAVSDADRVAVILGSSGMGKSTVAAALIRSGAEPLTDDVVPMWIDDRGTSTAAGYGLIKLWPDAAEKLGLDVRNMELVDPGDQKFAWELAAPSAGRRSVASVYVLGEGDGVRIEPISPAEAVAEVTRQVYQAPHLQAAGLQEPYLERVAALVRSTPVRRLIRGSIGGLDAVAAAVRADLASG